MDTPSNALGDQFLTQGLHLRGCSARTIRTYRQGLATLPATLNKGTLAAWVVELRQRGPTPGGIDMYARTINSYLSWLHAEGHVSDRLRIKLLPNPPKPLRALSDAEIPVRYPTPADSARRGFRLYNSVLCASRNESAHVSGARSALVLDHHPAR